MRHGRALRHGASLVQGRTQRGAGLGRISHGQAGTGRDTASPSVSSSAASTPSSEVPLIRPMTFWMRSLCYCPPVAFRVYTMPSAPSSSRNFLRPLWRAGLLRLFGPEELDTLFRSERVTAYIGFDCTAKSMHIGNLVQLMTLRRLQQAAIGPSC
jgi:hypothetical protein